MKALFKIFPRDIVRKLIVKNVKDSAFREYLKHKIPSRKDQLNKLEFIALDFETTGLDVNKDQILSIGYTVIKSKRIVLAESDYQVIRQQENLQSDNVAIHKITDSEASQGLELKQCFDQLLLKMSGKVLLAHHADIELGFLNAACKQFYGHQLPVRVVDTMALEKKRLQRRHAGIKPNQLRLFNIRKAYGLPRYNAHNALEDAIATAEVFLVMINRHCGEKKCSLQEFL
ncbi:MAG: exonuclease domain-containing protein [Gammaproteobacteria bacterium]|nr:exonuclease domain-containing protein [Gammaproteobacteria bacterium]